jgi:hypothetical protein
MGAAQVLGQADVVQAAVVADGDDAGGVDAVVAHPGVRRDAVAGGEGFGSDGAIPLLRQAVNDLLHAGQLLGWGIPATAVLVDTLLDRCVESDIHEAENAIERLAASLASNRLVTGDVVLLGLHARLARARGDETAYRQLVDRYRARATSHGFEGHMAMAEALSTATP